MMLTVKLTKSSSSDPQDAGLQPAVNPPCWASTTAVGLNLTIPRRVFVRTLKFVKIVYHEARFFQDWAMR